ncbi:MAG TPA: hypothetical protein VM599_05970 [Thermoanaerobaculia bacterium]|nr:hypothetical protein [Thermoanaerobaculia bacterium]
MRSLVEEGLRLALDWRRQGERYRLRDASVGGRGLRPELEGEHETLYVLENRSLMRQIARSVETHDAHAGRRASAEELDEIDRS